MKIEKLLTEKEQERLEEHFRRFARVDAEPEYWINEKEAGDSYCRECAVKKVEELKAKEPDNEDISVDGGYGIEGDSTPFCDTCRRLLENTFTQYACQCEVDHFEENGFKIDSGDDCYFMDKVIGSSGWGPLEFEHDPEWKKQELSEYYEQLHALGKKILTDIQKFEGSL